MKSVVAFVSRLLRYTGGRAAIVMAFMTAAALTEGFGLVMLLPIMHVMGLGSATDVGPQHSAMYPVGALDSAFQGSLPYLVGIFVLTITIRQLLVYAATRLSEGTRIGFVTNLREELFGCLCDTDWRTIRIGGSRHFGQILLMNSWRVGDAAQSAFLITSASLIAAVNFLIAAMLSPSLALAVLIGIGVLILIHRSRYTAVRLKGSKITNYQNEMYTVVENYIDSLRVAKLANAQARMRDHFGSTLANLAKQHTGFVDDFAATRMALQIGSTVGIGVFLVFAVEIIGTQGPQLALLIMIAARLVPQCTLINQHAQHLVHHLPAFEEMEEALRDCRENVDIHVSDPRPIKPTRSISLRNIQFNARGLPGKQVLAAIDLDIPVGQILAVEGLSGAGKSTLADVVSGLLRPDAGNILIDGEKLDEGLIASWRAGVGYVPQHSVLLEDSIRRNLLWLLDKEPDQGLLDRVLACTSLDTLLSSLPDGLRTNISRREGVLSGGERQRIAISRELLRRPWLLILDEATSALDPDSESRILSGVVREFPRLTIIIISHRPATTAYADRVITLDGGRIVADRLNCAERDARTPNRSEQA